MKHQNKSILLLLIFLYSCKADNPMVRQYIKNFTTETTGQTRLSHYIAWEHEEEKIPVEALMPARSADSVHREGAPLYFNHIFSIIPGEDGYIISDDQGGRVILTDKKMNLQRIIGRPGPGPGEFGQARITFRDNGLLYTFATSNRGFAVKDLDGNPVYNFKPQTEAFNPVTTRFLVQENKLYYSTPNSPLPITAIDMEGNVQQNFGAMISRNAQEGKRVKARGHLLPFDEGSFLFVGENGPIIQRYAYDGNLLEEHNFMDHPFFEPFFRGVQERIRSSGNSDMTYLLFQDAEYVDGKLYLLSYQYDKDAQVSLDKVLVMKREGGQFFLDKLLKLEAAPKGETRWFESIGVGREGSELAAFESLSGRFLFYSLTP